MWGSLWCILTEGGPGVALDTFSPDMCHALLLPQWSEDVCAAHLTQRDGYQATTQGQLKEQLYQEIIHYFDKGKVNKKKKAFLLLLWCFPLYAHLAEAGFVTHDVCGTGHLLQVVYWKFYAWPTHWHF